MMRRVAPKTLVAIPVYNEQKYVTRVLDEVRKYAKDILVVDDGSTDDTPILLAKQPVEVVRHATNRGYGQSMIDAFRWARCYEYEWLITMDCDEQHEPASLPDFYKAIAAGGADVVSGSRYLSNGLPSDMPPSDRRAINREVTQWVNCCLSVPITDAFCGFKAYRVESLRKLRFSERGYAFPLQFWVQAAANGLRVVEVPIRLIYNDPNRSFGGKLDDPQQRLAHYREIFEQEMAKFPTLAPAMQEVEPCSCCCESAGKTCEPAAGCTGPVGVDDEGK